MRMDATRRPRAARPDRAGAHAGASALACIAVAVALLVDTARVGAVDARREGAAVTAARADAFAAARPSTRRQAGDAQARMTLSPETERGWRAYVAATEQRIAAELAAVNRGFFAHDFARAAQTAQAGDGQHRDGQGARSERTRALAGDVPLAEMRSFDAAGRPLEVPDALVSHWRGTILLPGVTLDQLWTRLRHPNERGPFQPDVLALRVLAREPDALTLFIKMTRTKLVTVTYDTEHRVTFHRDRARPTRAWSRSEATRIAEVTRTESGGQRELSADEEHGFLWRLHAYWRYEQVPGGVLVELESLTLSRDIPFGFGAIVGPIVDRIARESMTRTLVGIRTEYAGTRPASTGAPTAAGGRS